MPSTLPPTHLALQVTSTSTALILTTLPTPHPTLGSATIRILSAKILSYHREVYNGCRHYSFPTPLVGGISAIGRIAALGPDATRLTEGQLVYIDCVIRARDDPDTLFLSAIHDSGAPGSAKLMKDVWRDGTFAEYARFPLENCIALNEDKLCRTLGYSVHDLMYMAHLLVPFGGLRDIGLEPGETVVVSPATGGYGGAGVAVAVAMGARVIALGRNEGELQRLKTWVRASKPGAHIETVVLTGDEERLAAALVGLGPIDAILDLTPPHASESTHLRCATSALRRGGRVSVMGFVERPVVPWEMVGKNITLRGKLMYEREDMLLMVKMLEAGLFPRGEEFVGTKVFGLEQWEAAFEEACTWKGVGRHVVFQP